MKIVESYGLVCFKFVMGTNFTLLRMKSSIHSIQELLMKVEVRFYWTVIICNALN